MIEGISVLHEVALPDPLLEVCYICQGRKDIFMVSNECIELPDIGVFVEEFLDSLKFLAQIPI